MRYILGALLIVMLSGLANAAEVQMFSPGDTIKAEEINTIHSQLSGAAYKSFTDDELVGVWDCKAYALTQACYNNARYSNSAPGDDFSRVADFTLEFTKSGSTGKHNFWMNISPDPAACSSNIFQLQEFGTYKSGPFFLATSTTFYPGNTSGILYHHLQRADANNFTMRYNGQNNSLMTCQRRQ